MRQMEQGPSGSAKGQGKGDASQVWHGLGPGLRRRVSAGVVDKHINVQRADAGQGGLQRRLVRSTLGAGFGGGAYSNAGPGAYRPGTAGMAGLWWQLHAGDQPGFSSLRLQMIVDALRALRPLTVCPWSFE